MVLEGSDISTEHSGPTEHASQSNVLQGTDHRHGVVATCASSTDLMVQVGDPTHKPVCNKMESQMHSVTPVLNPLAFAVDALIILMARVLGSMPFCQFRPFHKFFRNLGKRAQG